MVNFLRVAILVCCFSAATWASAASLVVDNTGELLGATEVEVAGTTQLYDVTFVDGLFTNLFVAEDYNWITASLAHNFSQALIDSVLIDSIDGNFASHPTYTFGVSSDAMSYVDTPFGTSQSHNGELQHASRVTNTPTSTLINDDFWVWTNTNSISDAAGATFVFAKWSVTHDDPSPNPVPEPATFILFGSGLAGLAFYRRKKK